MLLYDRIERLARDQYVDFLGIADLASAHDFISVQGGEQVASYPRAISIGIALLDPMSALCDSVDGRTAGAHRPTHAGAVWRLPGMCGHLPGRRFHRTAISGGGASGGQVQCPKMRAVSPGAG
jgi:hypothetical protein